MRIRCKPDEKTSQWPFSAAEAIQATRELGEKTSEWITDELGRRSREILAQGT